MPFRAPVVTVRDRSVTTSENVNHANEEEGTILFGYICVTAYAYIA